MKMKVFFTSLFVMGLLILCGTQSVFSQDAVPWYQNGPWTMRRANPKLKALPLIQVKGNRFVDPDGTPVLFRGIAIADPDKVERQGHLNQAHFEKVKELGGNIVRVPIHPTAWQERGPAKYMQLLDSIVEWCTDLKMYVMLDWHTIGNLEMEMFQDPMYVTTKQETYDFWRKIAQHFNGHNTVAFYELFNEPTTYRGQLGTCSWSDWKKLCENMITVIRYSDKETIPLVAGFDWAYDLTPLLIEPINAQGIGYTTHPYPNKRPKPWQPRWDENFGFAADTYPVFATEFGFDPRTAIDPDGDHYGNDIIGYLEGKNISWAIWVFDPEWGGAKIKSYNYELTPSAEFFKKAMHKQLKVQQPEKK